MTFNKKPKKYTRKSLSLTQNQWSQLEEEAKSRGIKSVSKMVREKLFEGEIEE